VAIVEKGPMGGTCLNRGCIPSKMLIHSADVADIINNAKTFGINPKGYTVDFKKLVTRVSKTVDKDARDIEAGIKEDKNTTLYKTTGKFIGERTLNVGNETIKGEKIVIAAGTRPTIPPVEGINDVDYMTSKEALRITKQPKSLTVLGGGYIGTELGHFYGALGTKVTIIQRRDILVPNEDEDIAKAFTKIYKKKYNVLTGFSAKKVSKKNNQISVEVENKSGRKKSVVSEKLLVATGRIPNTDILEVLF